jgi:hypothetical protein
LTFSANIEMIIYYINLIVGGNKKWLNKNFYKLFQN